MLFDAIERRQAQVSEQVRGATEMAGHCSDDRLGLRMGAKAGSSMSILRLQAIVWHCGWSVRGE